MKKFIFSLITLLPVIQSHSQAILQNDRCIPFLIDDRKGQKIYIKDSCIKDTVRVQVIVEVRFEQSLMDTLVPIIVNGVELRECRIYYIDNPEMALRLTYRSDIENPFYHYIWDLMSAKVSYWYRCQPYEELLSEDRKNAAGNVIRMTAPFWLIPSE